LSEAERPKKPQSQQGGTLKGIPTRYRRRRGAGAKRRCPKWQRGTERRNPRELEDKMQARGLQKGIRNGSEGARGVQSATETKEGCGAQGRSQEAS